MPRHWRITSGVQLWRETQTGTLVVDEAGDRAASDSEERGHLVQGVIVLLIGESNLLS